MNGPLPLDRTHDIKLYGTYAFDMGLNVSLGLELESGAPLTALAAHPVYDSGGEIPLTPRGDGFQTSDGFQTRTPWTRPVNAGVSYNLKVGSRSLLLIADAFNVFNYADDPRLQHLLRDPVRRSEPGLRRGRRVWRRPGQQLVHAAADPGRRALRVLSTLQNYDDQRRNRRAR